MLLTPTQSTTRTVFFSCQFDRFNNLRLQNFQINWSGCFEFDTIEMSANSGAAGMLVFNIYSVFIWSFTFHREFMFPKHKMKMFLPFFGACVFVMIQVIYLRKIYLVQSSSKNLNWNSSLHYCQVEFRFNFFEHDYFDEYLLKYSDNK